MTAKFCDENGVEVSPGETGELFLKGSNVFRGYLNGLAGNIKLSGRERLVSDWI